MIIKKISGGCEARLRLEQLGFVPGASVVVVCTMGGNLIVNVKGSRVAIGEGLARKIMV